MGKQRIKKRAKQEQQQQKHGMEVEAGGGASKQGGGGDDGWLTGPASGAAETDADFIGMDTGEAGAAAAPPPRQPGEKVERVRGRATSKQKARKRKSMEKAMAVASRKETKVIKGNGLQMSKKALKKLWANEPRDA